MTTISGIVHGEVSVEDGTKGLEEYAPARKVHVHLSFDVEADDLPTMLDHVADLANAKVNELLGRAALKDEIVVPKLAPTRTAAIEKAVTPARAELSDKDKLAAKAGLTPRKKTATVDPADFDMDLMVTTAKPAVSDDDFPPEDPIPEDDDMSDLLGPVVPDVTDADLLSKITHKNGATKNAKAIRALVDKHAPDQARKYQAIEIPQANRAAFLSDLEKVPKLMLAGA